ncbi:dipeptide epimerase [Rhodopirellula sp. JC740]|uniref:Dipeptide epimerase n=1 Tax=Rhodopirellula halodulae TaxID=2894198 RepID=A0ABS8NK70_9BACT|nr:dipeptide epimerase [Rhodopirellula sp. JC740]MCC9643935.1 dipeptide epimerase [Rhodopirellula sp. JC740]
MNLQCYPIQLPLRDPFTISRGTITHQESLLVQIEHDGIVGLGEVTANDYYGHTIEAMSDQLRSLSQGDLAVCFNHTPEEAWSIMAERLGDDRFTLSAIDMACHDWHARRIKKPVWNRWNLAWNDSLKSSFTIGIDTIEVMKRKLAADSGWPVYKIKLGTEHDLDLVRELRSCTDAIFRVDANCAWTAEQTIQYSHELRDLNVEFIEQPLPRSASDADKQRVFEQSVLPIIADEDCQTESDLETCFEFFHGINVKLCKCGGLTPAKSMLEQARAKGKHTMIGCMVESPVGISGAAQLNPLLDFADLDGANLISDSPASGLKVRCGHLITNSQPGTGASLDRRAVSLFAINQPMHSNDQR